MPGGLHPESVDYYTYLLESLCHLTPQLPFEPSLYIFQDVLGFSVFPRSAGSLRQEPAAALVVPTEARTGPKSGRWQGFWLIFHPYASKFIGFGGAGPV